MQREEEMFVCKLILYMCLTLELRGRIRKTLFNIEARIFQVFHGKD